jgi:hypothetical protein
MSTIAKNFSSSGDLNQGHFRICSHLKGRRSHLIDVRGLSGTCDLGCYS